MKSATSLSNVCETNRQGIRSLDRPKNGKRSPGTPLIMQGVCQHKWTIEYDMYGELYWSCLKCPAERDE